MSSGSIIVGRMEEVAIRPLLAHAPEQTPPGRWWVFVLPVLLAGVGIFLATMAAKEGQAGQRELEQAEQGYRRELLSNELGREQARASDAGRIVRLQVELAAAQRGGMRSYLKPGRQFTHWDGYRYEEIIDGGYVYEKSDDALLRELRPGEEERRLKNVVWYPLYPLLGAGVKKVTGWPTHQALTAVSQGCAVLGAVVLFALARRHFYNRMPALTLEGKEHIARRWDLSPADTGALWTVALVVLGPTAVFLYANYTESLFLLLLAAFLLCIQKRAWWAAAEVAAVASSCRSQGVLFGPVLALTYLARSDLRRWPARVGMAVVLGAVSGLGILGYMLYLQVQFGDALAFMTAQQGWHVGIRAETLAYAANPVNALTNFFYYVMERPVDWARLWEAACVVGPPVLLMLVGARFLSFEQELMAWLLWGLPYVSNCLAASSETDLHWMSMGRFMAVVIPLQLIAGAVIVRFRWLSPVVLALAGGMFVLFSYKFGAGMWVG